VHTAEENGPQRGLSEALAKLKRLKEENERLKKLLEIRTSIPGIIPASNILSPASVTTKSSKIRLFRSLFRGRDDVYAIRWEGRNGKSGYFPACIRDARNFFVSKAEAIKQRQLMALTDQVIHDHLSGKLTAGIYLFLIILGPYQPTSFCWGYFQSFFDAGFRPISCLSPKELCIPRLSTKKKGELQYLR